MGKAATAVLDRHSETDDILNEPVSTRNARINDAVTDREPDHEEVQRLAYALWEQGGCRQGTAEEDWYRAEEILRSNGASSAAA
jgi:hypothetical protein